MEFISTDTPYGLSLALSGIALLGFAALTFLGLNYHFEGNSVLSVAIVLIGAAILVSCLVKICRTKRMIGSGTSVLKEGIYILAVMAICFAGSMPLSSFMRVLDHKKEFQANVDSTVMVVKTIGPSYRDYANERVSNYRNHLQRLYEGSADYDRELSGAAGDTKRQKIDAVTRSLQRRLLSDDMMTIEQHRAEWLEGLHDVDVWNVFTPRNIALVANASERWVGEYRRVSELMYAGEECEPFSMPELQGRMSEFIKAYTALDIPDTRGMAISLTALALMMTPYFLIRRNTKGRTGTHS